ncbi:allatotropins-like [Bacillus rossius redtenbacheri]|uniref:allatotropins-like n=1 Tax=Bacillus rossius redtenbacheri TaxID=93214 RepID=UPI002FDEEEFB
MRSYTAQMLMLALLLAALSLVAAGPRSYPSQRSKPRAIRGFKNAALSTARGFGKRDGSELPDPDQPERFSVDSLPVDWFVQELRSNPELARIIVHKFVDADQDGELSAEELLRPVY